MILSTSPQSSEFDMSEKEGINLGGRPRMYEDSEEFAADAEAYFDKCEADDRIPTIAGLAYHLGFASRQSLYDYAEDTRFSDTISRVRLLIEADRSERLVSKDKYTPGLPMDLASNHGWYTAKNANEHTGKNGRPIETVDLSKLNDEQLEAYGRLCMIVEGLDPGAEQAGDEESE